VFSLSDAEICNAIRSYEKYKASEKKHKQGSGSVSKNAATESVFLSKLSRSKVKAVALTRAPENEGENQDMSLETTFTLSLAGHIDIFFSGAFVCNLWFLLIVWVDVVSCRVTL